MLVRSGDAEIHYEILGSGPEVVLLHPFPATRNVWRPVAVALSARYRMILPDLRGHGDSGTGEGPATMAKHAQDLARVCDDAGVGKAVFAGNSIGGYILLECWRQWRERIRGLVLCDTKAQADTAEGRATRLKSVDEVRKNGSAGFVENNLQKLLGASTRDNRPDIVDTARKMMQRATVEGIAAVQQGMAERPDSVATLATIDVPALVVVGDEDVVTPPGDAELMQRSIRGSELRRIAKAGHYAPLEQAEAVTAAMREFLSRIR
ncbi:MAG TPA: alpha/beta fold hydrolase [Terriglobales bacterium]|nr:alpha/beta fold hydrolase [Terriglobales bacterium]